MGQRGDHYDGQNATIKLQTGSADSMGGRWREMKDEVESWDALRSWNREQALVQAREWVGRMERGETSLSDVSRGTVLRHAHTLLRETTPLHDGKEGV